MLEAESPLTSLEQVREQAMGKVLTSSKPKLAVVHADDLQILSGVNRAFQTGLVEPVLIGSKKAIQQTLNKLKMKGDCCEIIGISDTKRAIFHASEMVGNGEVAIMIQGNIEVPDFFRFLFDESCSFRRRGDFLSLVGVMEHEAYDGLLLLSDVGLIPDPTVEQGIGIINNAVEVARLLGKKTVRVGLLAFEDAPVPQSPTSIAESIISEFFYEETDPSVIVEGPIRLDLALKPDAIPCIPTEGIKQGKADVLIANNIHAGNSMYKAMITLCGAASAPIVVGGRCPIALPSRSESAENILNSIAMAVLAAKW